MPGGVAARNPQIIFKGVPTLSEESRTSSRLRSSLRPDVRLKIKYSPATHSTSSLTRSLAASRSATTSSQRALPPGCLLKISNGGTIRWVASSKTREDPRVATSSAFGPLVNRIASSGRLSRPIKLMRRPSLSIQAFWSQWHVSGASEESGWIAEAPACCRFLCTSHRRPGPAYGRESGIATLETTHFPISNVYRPSEDSRARRGFLNIRK